MPSAPVHAQSSIVPALHPVYDWLEMQRVNGLVPKYQHEVRPQSRATIVALLHGLEQDSTKLSRMHRNLLRDFLSEFDMDRLIANRLFTREFVRALPGSIPRDARNRKDPVLYAGQSRDSTFSGALYAEIGLGNLSLSENGTKRSGYLASKGFKAFANTDFGLGFHVQAQNMYIADHRELLAFDEKLGTAHGYRVAERDASSSFETFMSYRRPYLELHLGRGSLAMGPALTDPLVIRPEAPNIGSIRMQVGTPTLNLVLLHGSLDIDPELRTEVFHGDTLQVKYAPQRWVSMQRLTWQPISQLTLALHEMTIYSARGIDFDYLNPVNPQFFSQWDKGDRDNSFAGADLVTRPIRGTELFGSLLIDDIKELGELFKLDTSKVILSVGGRQRLLQNLQLGASYTRSDAYMYSHFQRLNAWEQSGRPLGHTIGPNATEAAVRLTSWLPLRTRVMVGMRRIRKGLNPVDSTGAITRNVGGDLFEGDANDYPGLFNGAELHNINRLELELETELIRALNISFKLRDDKVTLGRQIPSSRFIDFRLRYGF
ncbi:MAG: hypothetical protein ACO1Q7_09040 [Gemmatimonas sp.]